MAQYRYTGPHPVTGDQGEAVHPLDVREFDEEPAWGPWELVAEPEAENGDGDENEQPASSPVTPVTLFTPPAGTEGNM